jgi:DinB superfamily
MKRTLVVFVLLATATAFAQNNQNPVTSVVREILPRQQKNILAAAEEMPADKFGFRPTPEQMAFGNLVLHIIQSNSYLCGKIGEVPEAKTLGLKGTDGKDRLVAALKASFDFCSTALGKVDDSKLGDKVELFGGREGLRAFALIALTNDWADHYSAAAMYLRLNGLLPPTAQEKK